MRAHPVVDVILHWPVDPHLVGIREEPGLPVSVDKADENLVARLDPDGPTAIVDRGRNLALPIRTERAVEPDALHGVV